MTEKKTFPLINAKKILNKEKLEVMDLIGNKKVEN
jgi:hypothetical protein